MSEEPKAPETPPPASVDPAAIKAVFQEALKEQLPAILEHVQRASQPPPVQTPPAADPVGDLIRPYIAEPLARVALQSNAAMNAVTFYTDPRHALASHFKDAIEKKFNELMAQGRPLAREDIWKWYQGDQRESVEALRQKQTDESMQRAYQATTVGGGMAASVAGGATDPWSMKPEDLEKALESALF